MLIFFTELAPRRIQSINHNFRLPFIVVPLAGSRNRMDWILLVKERIAKITTVLSTDTIRPNACHLRIPCTLIPLVHIYILWFTIYAFLWLALWICWCTYLHRSNKSEVIVHDAYEPKAFDYAKACKHAYNYKQFKFTSGANAPQFLAVAVPGGCWLCALASSSPKTGLETGINVPTSTRLWQTLPGSSSRQVWLCLRLHLHLWKIHAHCSQGRLHQRLRLHRPYYRYGQPCPTYPRPSPRTMTSPRPSQIAPTSWDFFLLMLLTVLWPPKHIPAFPPWPLCQAWLYSQGWEALSGWGSERVFLDIIFKP